MLLEGRDACLVQNSYDKCVLKYVLELEAPAVLFKTMLGYMWNSTSNIQIKIGP